jgi:hypothetical protein
MNFGEKEQLEEICTLRRFICSQEKKYHQIVVAGRRCKSIIRANFYTSTTS